MNHDRRCNKGRRQAIKSLGYAVAAAGMLPVVLRADSHPDTALDEASDQAKALGYRHITADVDKSAYPRHDVSQNCRNCQLYQSQERWGPCALFPGKQVSADGWCSAWVKRSG